jgi:fibronectin type 3 domain-containing protein
MNSKLVSLVALLLAVMAVLWILSVPVQAQQLKAQQLKAAATSAPDPSVALTCTAPTTGVKPDSYNFYRSTVSGGPYTKLGSSATCAYTDTTAAYSTTYYFVATSVNTTTCPAGQTCESTFSNQATAVVGANPIPNPPSALTVGTITLSKVSLSWKEDGPYFAFRVYRKPVTRSWWSTVATGVKTPYWTNTNVPSGTWNYEVRAVNHANNVVYLSNPSNVVTAQVQ